MAFHTEIEINIGTEIVEALIVQTIKSRRIIQGDSFATADEADSLLSDPLANIYLVEGQLIAWATLRHPSHRIEFVGLGVYGRFVCLEFRVKNEYCEMLATQYLEDILPLRKTQKNCHRAQKDLVKATCQSVKNALGLPSENRLGTIDEATIEGLVATRWAQFFTS